MPTNEKAMPGAANLPDPAEVAAAWTRIFSNAIDTLHTIAERSTKRSDPPLFDPYAPARAMADFKTALWSNPVQLFDIQKKLLEEWTTLWTRSTARALGQECEPLLVPEKGDRRFNDSAWTEHAVFDHIKQAYLLATRQTTALIAASDLDPKTGVRVEFYARQLLNALSPANFAFTNPEAIRKALETGGVSLLSGLANMLADAASPSGMVQRRSEDDFELGVTIAATPGSVIYQNELMQLIQYSPTTTDVLKRPLLYVPPLVNKYYLLDLQPKSSMVKWLVDQGHTVFVISWINPGPELADQSIAEYIRLGPIAALNVIEEAVNERTVDIFGFCMGGTLLAIAAAYLAATGQSDRMGSVSMIGTLLDFSNTGEWATFYEPSHMEAFERHVRETGVIGADKLQALFSVVRANDLIWSSVVNHYLLDRTAPASDLLYWFADGSRIPQAFLLDYATQLLRGNLLREPGGIVIDGVSIDLGKIDVPAFMISLKDDHVSGWEATYAGAKLFGGPTRFLLGGSGHNAGLINPPAARKHGYWANDELPGTAEQWLAGADKLEGSWWPAWQQWLAGLGDGKRVQARTPGEGPYPALEEAPGSYVRMK